MATSPLDAVPQSTARLDLLAASRDLWPGGTLAFWQGEPAPAPARVFWPRTDAEVHAVLEAAVAAGVSVVPYGAGSGVCGGARGQEGAWVLDLKRLDALGVPDPHTWTVEAEAGVNGQHLEDALEAAGYTLGHSPSSILCSTVGGWAAARSAGQFSSWYGAFEDMVLGLDAVAPGIGPFHVGVPGPHSPAQRADDAWLPLLLGSEGTLAVITRLRMRIRPAPERRWLRGYRFKDVPHALSAMRQLMQGELWPSVVRLYDPFDTLVGGKTRPKPEGGAHQDAWWKGWLQAVDGLPELRRRSLVLPLSMPGLVQRLGEGLASGCLLIVGWEGCAEVVEAASQAGHALLTGLGEDLGVEPGERWFHSRHAVSYKLMPVFERGGFADTMEVAARWSVMPQTYEAVRRAVSPHAVIMAHMSHVYPEGGCIYFSFAGRGDRAVYDRVWAAALEAVLASGATTTHHHGVGTLKAAVASREIGPAVRGWRALKHTLDPRRILNPGRLFVDVPVEPSLPAPSLPPEDGLAWVDPKGPLDPPGETLWGWESLPAPAPWGRSPWQTGWLDVRGEIDGVGCALGRGPRSAAGPDLRGWLFEVGDDVEATLAMAADGPRWMGAASVDRPWTVARDILRADLRPACLGVVDGALFVGFRGPAAEAFADVASALVPGGLERVPWRAIPRASGHLDPCGPDAPDIVGVTSEHWLRRRGGPQDA